MLFQKLSSTVLDSRAKTTVSKYIGYFKRFVLWTRKYSEITSILPCNELHVSLYLQHLIDNSSHYSVVEAAFYGIKWAHHIAGVKNPCDSDFVRSILDASKRMLSRPIQKKTPVDPDIMKKLFNFYNKKSRSLKDLRLLCMCDLAYTGFFRYNELCNIKAKHISFTVEYADIFIEKSKTDCYRKGKNVYIAKLDSPLCPVKILKSYLAEAKIEMNSDMYIFRSLTFLENPIYLCYALRMRNYHIHEQEK
ncbi:unnamed protein product [Mytilus edulis]|uniref:Tyr recombinase domain-containing protein n=1 Tax=Mytilus edulis TaxID=6550 RepID=A0A8S3QAR1_MYTED|nr:unnamed protein product [Mytilus edulis]